MTKIRNHYDEKYFDYFMQGEIDDDTNTFTYKQTRPMMRDITKILEKNKIKKVLEVGCGMGINTADLNDRGFKCFGVDFSSKFIDRALKRYGNYYQEMDCESEEFLAEGFECIFGLDFIEHLFDYHKAIDNFYKALEPNGLLILATPNLLSLRNRANILLGKTKTFESFEHLRFFSPKMLKDILEDHKFKVLDIITYGRLKQFKSLSGTFMIVAIKEREVKY